MEYKIIEINDKNKKAEYTNNILRKLPEWFGNEDGLTEYVNTVNKYPYWAAFDKENNCVGFFLEEYIITELVIFMYVE
jgi:hypothetical protein